MKKPKLSLCMIAKDEADNIAACVESVRGLVDEIVVVDTGSADQTQEVARSLGAKVYFFAWNNDFSAARNESLRYATGEWILVLDADEVIDARDHRRIRKLLSVKNVDGYRLVQRTYQNQSTLAEWKVLEAETPLARGCPGYIPSPLVRLFRNVEQVRFRGRVHELVEYDLLSQGRAIVDTDIAIHHYGKILGQERLRRKKELYRRIGEEKLRDHPFNSRAFCELGIQYLELDLNAEAEKVLRRAHRLDPRDPKAAFNLAVALSRLGGNQEAARMYRTVLALDPAHIGAYNNLAEILLREGMNNEVEDLYRTALRYNPHHHVLHYNYGLFLEKEGHWRKAVGEYRKALSIDADFAPAKNRLRSAPNLRPSSDMEEKERFTMKSDGQDSARTSSNVDFTARGLACLKQEKWTEALEAFVSALEHDKDNADLRYLCGYLLELLGQREAALEQYQEALKLRPRHVNTLCQLALEAWNQGLVDDCITLYREILAEEPDHLEAHYNLALALEHQGKYDNALVHIEKALELCPDPESIREKAAMLRNRLSQPDPAAWISGGDRKLSIAFLWGGLPFAGDSLTEKPLGGTETAMIHMARSLAQKGHHVRVFVKEGKGVFDRVSYEKMEGYLESLRLRPADVLIASRIFHPFLVDVPARVRIFWTEDAHDQPFVEFLSRSDLVNNIDRIFTVSQWQTRMLAQQFGIPEQRFWVTRNGIFWDHFKELPHNRNPKKLVYTSTPFRGLDVLLDLFPRIRERVPDVELDIYSSMSVYQVESAVDKALYGPLYKKARQPGVTLKGSVIQEELAHALTHAGILAYPNHFAETSCIAALEAMAAGLPVVTSRLGAMPETVSAGGILIEGDARSRKYQSDFVDAVCRLLEDPARWKELSEAGRRKVYEHHRWDMIADEWIAEFGMALEATAI